MCIINLATARPSQMYRRPLNLSLSRLKEVRPTSSVIRRRLSLPNWGSKASSMVAQIGPEPGTIWITFCFWPHMGMFLMKPLVSLSICLRDFSSQLICVSMSLRTGLMAVARRFLSVVSILASWQRLINMASSCFVSLSFPSGASGHTDWAYLARTIASMASVFARNSQCIQKISRLANTDCSDR